MIASLPLGVFLVMVAVLLAMTGVAVWAGLRARRRAALVRATPTTPIGMATDGYREFEGTIEAVAGPPVAAPLTRWPCCWYHAKVEEWERRTSSSSSRTGSWRTVREWTSGAPFFVRDRTGVCIVDPHRADVTPTDKSLWYGATAEPSDRDPAKVRPTESGKGLVEVSGGPQSRFRYSEERIYAGDPLLVLGEFASRRFDRDAFDGQEDDADAGSSGEDPDESEGDDDADSGDLDAEVERDEALFEQAKHVTRATIGRGSGSRPFIISTTPQDQYVALSTLGGTGALGVALVPLAIALLLIWARL